MLITAEIGWGSGLQAAERGPELLLEAGLADALQANVTRINAIPSMLDGALEGAALETAIMDHARRVSDAVLDAIQNGMFPVIIGGDHTSALGFHTGLARAHGKTGIIWVDTHPDLNTPETSPSGNIHGMPLAGLLGRGSEKMLETTAPCRISEEHVAMVGTRSIDEGEQKWLDEGTIHCMTMDVVKERGLSACLASAVNTANQAEAGYGLTIDIDAIDPSQAPFVATAVENGIDAIELAQVLKDLPRKDRLLGMEVTEFTPRDNEPEDAEVAANLITSLVNSVTGVVV
jgi:arginase